MTMFMCDMCYKLEDGWKEIGVICDQHVLVEQNGTYHILSGQGHKDDIIYTFVTKPICDPFDDENEEFTEEEQQFLEDLGQESFLMHFEDAVYLSQELNLGEGIPGYLLYILCGKVIEEYKNQ